MNLKPLLALIHESVETSTPAEIKRACELIIQAQSFANGERDTLRAAYERGPLEDGDLPSKIARDRLIAEGFIAKVIVRTEDGFNALTYRGLQAYRIAYAAIGIVQASPEPDRLVCCGKCGGVQWSQDECGPCKRSAAQTA